MVNKPAFDQPFHDDVTIRGNVELPVTIAGRVGHQGFVLTYSTKDGTDWESVDELILPPLDPSVFGTKNNRFYVGYTFNQILYQSQANPQEGAGLFGQFGVSDGNPNRLHWSVFLGVGGTGLVPGRSQDNWGVGYYYDALASGLKNLPPPNPVLRDEQGAELSTILP